MAKLSIAVCCWEANQPSSRARASAAESTATWSPSKTAESFTSVNALGASVRRKDTSPPNRIRPIATYDLGSGVWRFAWISRAAPGMARAHAVSARARTVGLAYGRAM
jgi:hypothetical protein